MMKLDDTDTAAARRESWRRSGLRHPGSTLRIDRSPTTPPLSFSELFVRLTKGRLSAETAHALLHAGSGDVSLNIRIDSVTGLVSHWSVRTKRLNSSVRTVAAGNAAPAA
ncbi:hypothetical protein [Sphingomonas sp. CROZ-RG-20F-R02-07]|uniref:hypothetical protein n=1 Tax=Sphingomonas sp. CROZ-RG-20F-R02-07 TaxID=2914832 RepID=UPI001F58ED04|nr:hypothetical protein [Sphingomonas sp. CROZ-RG-20F-R02-07]